jgi:hypothetical protein
MNNPKAPPSANPIAPDTIDLPTHDSMPLCIYTKGQSRFSGHFRVKTNHLDHLLFLLIHPNIAAPLHPRDAWHAGISHDETDRGSGTEYDKTESRVVAPQRGMLEM